MAKALLSHLHGLRAMRESSRGLTVKSSFICHSTRYCEKRNCHLKAKNLKQAEKEKNISHIYLVQSKQQMKTITPW